LILAAFPLLVLVGVYAVFFFMFGGKEGIDIVNEKFIKTIPFVIAGVLVWFLIAFYANSAMIQMATHSRPLERKENMRIYNLTENLCMSIGMKMPKLFIIDSPALNAFASGINEKTYAVTLTTGIIEKLNDEELEGVIAHELTHIRNKDVRLLIISIIFVGIFAFIVDILFRNLLYGGRRNKNEDNKLIIIALLVSAVAYFLSILFKFALSRRREYLADAGAVELTKNSHALASALRKISGRSEVESVSSEDVKQMFIEHKALDGSGIMSLFATHPPIEKRIAVLEQM
jgi:heat shock protein HtpX